MQYTRITVVCVLLIWSAYGVEDLTFHPGFKFGVSTAAYQVEGAWNASDKTESVWDHFCHEILDQVADGQCGNVACDSYHLWRRDIEMIQELAAHHYRFSISWPRLLPNGFSNKISSDGKNYYNNLIDGLLEKGIEPVVTLYHFDMPQILQDLGKISLANLLIYIEPLSPEYTELAELANEYTAGRYSHAIFSREGDWPPALKQYLIVKSNGSNSWQKLLPEFTQEDIQLMKGSFDYYAVNYSSLVIRPAKPGEDLVPWPLGDLPIMGAKLGKHPDWEDTYSTVLFVHPEGLRKQLEWLKMHYGDIPFLITENGYATAGGLDDEDRIDFFRRYLKQLLLSIKEDGVNVTGYTIWSLMDDFEWLGDYTLKLGLYQVDFSSPERTRTPRASAAFYKKLIQQNSLHNL